MIGGWTKALVISVMAIPLVIGMIACGSKGSVVTFPDASLEAAVREALVKPQGDIFEADVRGLTKLVATGKGITNLAGLEYCTRLTELTLYYNQISDLSPISGLTSLTQLRLALNNISDISPLSGLTRLSELNLAGNQIVDLSPLSNLNSLTFLSLVSNQISDIGPLVDNSGLSEEDQVALDMNPLSATSTDTHIPHLRSMGVVIFWESAFCCGRDPFLW